jgi:hypothetical protein
MFDEKGVRMSRRQNYFTILSELLPAGAMGVSVLLGSAVPGSANQHPPAVQPSAADKDGVSERLAAIREAVSAVIEPQARAAKPAGGDRRLAWGNWWNNWGWYRPRPWWGYGWPNWNNWRNWNNWPNWWRNW